MKTTKLITALALSLLAGSVLAAVAPEEAAKLGNSLTPLGAEKAGNADGSIPEWTGGLAKGAASVLSGGFLGDPFASEQPLFTITAQNLEQYRDKLSEGQVAMFKRYPATYRMPVYTSHRTTAVPQSVYAAAKTSAQNTTLVETTSPRAATTPSRSRRTAWKWCGTTSPATAAATCAAAPCRPHRRPTATSPWCTSRTKWPSPA